MNHCLFPPIVSIVIGSLVLGAPAGAQSPQSAAPSFEVASIKPSKDGRFGIEFQPSGRLIATHVDLFNLIVSAYSLQPAQLIGGPNWVKSDRFDVVAIADERMPRPVLPMQQQEMLQPLLSERFHLRTHTETRELAIYRLVRMGGQGQGGPSPTPAADCAVYRAAWENWRQSGQFGPPPPRHTCGFSNGMPGQSGTLMTFAPMSMQQFARMLGSNVGRVVVDATGLVGSFGIGLVVARDALPFTFAPSNTPVQGNAPTIFVALQEQLGLKLESTRGPVDVLVIDQVERPTPD